MNIAHLLDMSSVRISLVFTIAILFIRSGDCNGKTNKQWKNTLSERAEAVITLDSSGLQAFTRLGCCKGDRRDVSFSVYPSKRLKNPGNNVKVVFDSILVNKGGGYNAKIGTFVCPVSGNYMITVDALTQIGEFYWGIKVNGVTKGYLYCNISGKTWKPVSRTIIVSLKKGDQVYIVNMSGTGDAHDGMFTGFSGTLLK